MKTVTVNEKRIGVKYRTNSGMRTQASFLGKLFTRGLGCDVYNVNDNEHVALVLTLVNGDILNSTTVLTITEYEEIVELYDPCSSGRYHTALLEACGAVNHLCLA